ncbi:hypothetical protein NON00_15015 [Roseomonas sp. GC11]|uniref:hypothetical protein n=1 Tax=Roseomonas sp. GC11 TaxID=2950546 RepID=UPI00210DEBE1|nr:hypothetical protein [Roseomonas sp. GC11]MCQ4161233.1 hypothetical protein [Roseomonas sp. GC11]
MSDMGAISYLNYFESFGSNCEFGFVQERAGVDIGTLFRWAEILSTQALIKLIRADFENIYAFENLFPFNAGMVFDQSCDVAWHSKLRSELTNPHGATPAERFTFLLSEAERRAIWEAEMGKVQHLLRRTRKQLSEGRHIYVHKPRLVQTTSEADVLELHDVIKAAGGSVLLYVSVAEDPAEAGSVRMLRPGLIHGRIDRFAPGSNARDISYDTWLKLCAGALELSQQQYA